MSVVGLFIYRWSVCLSLTCVSIVSLSVVVGLCAFHWFVFLSSFCPSVVGLYDCLSAFLLPICRWSVCLPVCLSASCRTIYKQICCWFDCLLIIYLSVAGLFIYRWSVCLSLTCVSIVSLSVVVGLCACRSSVYLLTF